MDLRLVWRWTNLAKTTKAALGFPGCRVLAVTRGATRPAGQQPKMAGSGVGVEDRRWLRPEQRRPWRRRRYGEGSKPMAGKAARRRRAVEGSSPWRKREAGENDRAAAPWNGGGGGPHGDGAAAGSGTCGRRTWSRGRGPASPEGAGGTWRRGFGIREAQALVVVAVSNRTWRRGLPWRTGGRGQSARGGASMWCWSLTAEGGGWRPGFGRRRVVRSRDGDRAAGLLLWCDARRARGGRDGRWGSRRWFWRRRERDS